MSSSIFSLEHLSITDHAADNDKRPVVFVHGNSQNSSCGYGVIEFFKEKGHRVLSYDLPGHGNSALETHDYQFLDLIDLNNNILSEYSIQSPILIGHSLGGMIHCGTVAKYSLSDASLALCGSLDANPTFVAKKHLPAELADEISAALTAYMNEGFRLFKRQKLYDYFENRQVEDQIVNIINRRYSDPKASFINLDTLAEFDVRAKLKKLEIPILVMHGRKEQVIHPALVEAMVTEYDDIRAEWYPENGHLAFYQQPELTNQYLTKHYQYLTQ